MDNHEYGDHKFYKKRARAEKRELKQIGNQQKRTRVKAALRDMMEGKTDFIDEPQIDNPTKYLNGFDKPRE